MGIRADSESLRQLPLFRDCDPVAMQVLCFAAEKQEFATGEEIVSQGAKARAAFLLLDGRAMVTDGPREVAMAEPGAFLGEVAMLRAGPYAVTAKASGTVMTLRISQELFLKVVKEYPAFGARVLQNLGDRLGQHMRELEPVRVQLTKSRNFTDLG
jgi:CRP/FNR family transcriptional regulator, cyclic AMP receptor protein